MHINIIYDASVATCPNEAAFKACVQGVANFYDTQFNNPITVNIHVGWGEVDGQTLPPDSGAASISNYAGLFTYAQVRAALSANATTADDKTAVGTLPAGDPAPAGTFSMTTAEAKALGLMGASSAADGYTGIDSATTWIFNTTNTNGADVPNGDADAFSFLAHEFSEILGRQMNFGAFSGFIGGGFYPLDLFDYKASGVRSFSSSATGRYFSINGGATDLKNFNSNTNGDLFDWAPGSVPDSYDWEGSKGAVSATDLRLIDIIGYNPSPDFTASSLAAAGAAFNFHINDISAGAASASTAGFYLSTTSKVTKASTLVATSATAAIAAKGSVAKSIAPAFSAALAPGTYYVGVIANYNGAVTESNSANNVSNAVPIVIVANSNIASIGGVAGVDAFDPGSVTLSAALALDGSLTVTGSLTTAAGLSGTGTLALAGGTTTFNPGTSLTVAKVTQAATANVALTTLNYAGTWTQTAGTLSVASGDRVNFFGAGDSFAGTLAGAGTVAFTGGSDTLAGTTLSGASAIMNTAAVTLTGAITISTALTVTSANVVVAAAGASLAGGGVVSLTNSATNKIIGATASATLTNASDRITGAGNLGGGLMKLINQAGGTINGNQTTALTIDTGAAAVTNAGIIENTGTGGTTIKSAVANTGSLIVTKGVLTVNGAVTGAGTVKIGGGTADFTGAFAENVAFTSTTGVLELAHSTSYTGSISGFSKTGTTSLDLLDIAFGASTKASYSGTTSSGTLTVTDGTHTAHVKLTGDYTTSVFAVAGDGHGGTTVVDPTVSSGAMRPVAPWLPFIAAAATFGAKGATNAGATLAVWRETAPALSSPRIHLA